MIKVSLFTVLALAAAPAVAQSEAAPAPSAAPASPGQEAIEQAAAAFNQCVSAGVQGLEANVAPEAGASAVVNGCAPQRQQLEQAVETVISPLPEEQKTAARQQLQTQLAQIEPQIAAAITQQRAAAPSAPAE
jgi:hypothetical protein